MEFIGKEDIHKQTLLLQSPDKKNSIITLPISWHSHGNPYLVPHQSLHTQSPVAVTFVDTLSLEDEYAETRGPGKHCHWNEKVSKDFFIYVNANLFSTGKSQKTYDFPVD